MAQAQKSILGDIKDINNPLKYNGHIESSLCIPVLFCLKSIIYNNNTLTKQS